MIVTELKKSILDYAIKGFLTKHNDLENIKNDVLKYKEVPFLIPNNWKWCKIKDISTLIRGSGIKRNETIEQGVQCIRYGEIYTHYGFSFEKSISFVSQDIAKNCKEVFKNDILLTLTGENEYDIAKATAYLGNEKLVAGGDIAILTNHHQNPMYLSYFFASSFCINQKSETAKGNIIVHTSTDKIGNYYIPLPPLEEQQRIVDKIEELFSKLDEIKTIEDELGTIKRNFPNDMKKSILKNAFDGKYSILPFNEWSDDKLINVCDEICTGNSIPANVKKTKYTNLKDGYNYIGTKDLKFDHSFEYETGVKIPFEEKNFKYANVNDILLCIEGGSAGKKIGKLDEKVCYGNKLCKFSSSKLNPKFLYYYLQSPQFTKNFYDNISGIIGGVSISKIKTINISFPTIEEQQRIADKLEELLPLCDDIEKLVEES